MKQCGLLVGAGFNDPKKSKRDDGIVLLVFITYSNTYSYNTNNINYEITVKAVSDTKFKSEQPIYTKNYEKRGTSPRHGVFAQRRNTPGKRTCNFASLLVVNVRTCGGVVIWNRHGVRLLFLTVGSLGKFDFQTLLLTVRPPTFASPLCLPFRAVWYAQTTNDLRTLLSLSLFSVSSSCPVSVCWPYRPSSLILLPCGYAIDPSSPVLVCCARRIGAQTIRRLRCVSFSPLSVDARQTDLQEVQVPGDAHHRPLYVPRVTVPLELSPEDAPAH